jgi:hypothetical protein
MAVAQVGLEATARRTFAWAIDWPGWCRSGKTEGDAIEALASYRDRYAPVPERAGVRFPVSFGFEVVEQVTGNATTDFGAPNIVCDGDRRALTAAQAKREAALLAACWSLLDDVVAGAPAALRKGPRGGGRDRDAVVAHVAEAEHSYATKLRIRKRDLGDTPFRDAVLAAVRAARGTSDDAMPVRAVVRRMAWHVLDHAWEIEDKSAPSR